MYIFFQEINVLSLLPIETFFTSCFLNVYFVWLFFPFLELPHKKKVFYSSGNRTEIGIVTKYNSFPTTRFCWPKIQKYLTWISQDLILNLLYNKAKNVCKSICSQDFLRRTLDNLWGYCCQNYAGYQGLLCQPKTECTK